MTTIITSFSVRAAPVHETGRDSAAIRSFCVRLQERHDMTGSDIVAERFNAGVQIRHLPEGEPEAVKSFSVMPSGYAIAGVPTPEHETIETDVLRYHANG